MSKNVCTPSVVNKVMAITKVFSNFNRFPYNYLAFYTTHTFWSFSCRMGSIAFYSDPNYLKDNFHSRWANHVSSSCRAMELSFWWTTSYLDPISFIFEINWGHRLFISYLSDRDYYLVLLIALQSEQSHLRAVTHRQKWLTVRTHSETFMFLLPEILNQIFFHRFVYKCNFSFYFRTCKSIVDPWSD